MTHICLVTALCDPPGDLLEKAERLLPALHARFTDIAANTTTNTHPAWFELLAEHGIITSTADADYDRIGAHRRAALTNGLANSQAPCFLYADPDHVLRWVERYPENLDATLKQIANWDCLVIGRSAEGFNAAPKRLRDTERIVNHTFALLTGLEWDLMMAARGLSRSAAELIANECREDTIGNDVGWPLLCRHRQLSLGYVEADGLRYETNRVYATSGVDAEDGDASAWMLRVRSANQHIDAMRPYLQD
jgi:hypothetical protein